MSSRWGIIPAAGRGTRIQPLAFSKELLPVGTRHDGGTERPRAVTEYLLERMTSARVNRICFVISAEKTDIVRYFGARIAEVPICYTVQQNPHGLCDALFSALPFVAPEDEILVGLPDTIWFPVEGFELLPDGQFSFLLFRPMTFQTRTLEQRLDLARKIDRSGGRRRRHGSRRPATPAPSTTFARRRSPCSSRPACCHISTRA